MTWDVNNGQVKIGARCKQYKCFKVVNVVSVLTLIMFIEVKVSEKKLHNIYFYKELYIFTFDFKLIPFNAHV